MPDESLELTQEEKNLIIERHKRLVDEFNQYLPDDKKIQYDKTLNDRLNDPKEIKYYKTLDTIYKKTLRQHEIENELMSNNRIPNDNLLLARSFLYGLKTENDDEAKEYNKKLFDIYSKEPERVFYSRIKNVLDFNPQKLLDVIDDKQKLADFYLENQEVCEDAFVISSTLENPNNNISPALKNAATGLSPMIECLGYPVMTIKRNMGDDYFVFPKLSKEQAELIIGNHPQYMIKGEKYCGRFATLLESNELSSEPIKESFNTILNHGYKLGNGFFYRYEALEHNDETNVTKEIPLDVAIKNLKNNGNICVRERAPEDMHEIRKINKAFDNEFSNIWKKKFSNNYDKRPFDYERIRNANKGNYFERLFRKTSPEYRAFINALRDYNNPNSNNYLNKDLLKDTAQAYFDYKTEQGVSFSKMDNTARDRLKLVSAVLKTFRDIDEHKKAIYTEIDNKILSIDEPKRVQAVEKNEVEDNIINNEIDNNINKNEIEAENKIEL